MALGQFADTNLALTSTLSEGGFDPAYPLGNLLLGDYLGHPARCATPAILASSKFKVVLPWPRKVTMVAVLFHSLSYSARYRLTVSDLAGDFTTPKYDSGWQAVVPALYKSSDLPWESPNWWTGQPLASEMDLYPRHLWIVLPADTLVAAFRLEINDAANPAGYFDLGGLWVASGWSPTFNFERGRKLDIQNRAQVDEAPSGRRFAEDRRPRRRLSVSWRGLFQSDAHRLADAFMRAGTTQPVLFVPDIDDPLALFREAFPATFEAAPAPTFLYEGLHQADATFEEIIA